MNISKLAYVAVVTPYVQRPPDEHKLHSVSLKTDERNLKYQRRPR
jgi:hypothetical protein